MEQLLTYLIGLQIGIAITALYFVVRIALMKITPPHVYWIFAVGILALLYRYVQIILHFQSFRTVLTSTSIIINTIVPLCLMVGFGIIYRLLRIKSHE